MTLLRTAAAAAILSSFIAGPVLAQQSRTNTPPSAPASGDMSDAMVHKVGAALRHVADIRQTYDQRAKTANNQQQMQDLNNQAHQEMLKAISDQGLTVQQYQQAIQMAQANPTLRQRVISAAQGSGE